MELDPKPNNGAKILLGCRGVNHNSNLHGPSLESINFINFQLFNDEDVEVIGTQMPQHVEGMREMSMRGEAEDVTRKKYDIGKKKRGMAVTTK